MRVILAAEESAGLQVLELLRETGHEIGGVLADPSRAEAGGASVWRVAESAGLRLWPARRVREPAFAEELRAVAPDLLLNVHSLYVIRGEILGVTTRGSFNLHPGPLPRYAGLNAVSWAIYRGEREHGVTLHAMEPGIDTGGVFAQASFPIEDTDSALAVSVRCVELGMSLIRDLLQSCQASNGPPDLTPQELARREYFGREVPRDGWIDWSRSAREVVNLVRACDYAPFHSPWGQARTRRGETTFSILKADRIDEAPGAPPGTVVASEGRTLQVAAGEGTVVVRRLAVDGRPVRPADHLALGDRLSGSEPGDRQE